MEGSGGERRRCSLHVFQLDFTFGDAHKRTHYTKASPNKLFTASQSFGCRSSVQILPPSARLKLASRPPPLISSVCLPTLLLCPTSITALLNLLTTPTSFEISPAVPFYLFFFSVCFHYLNKARKPACDLRFVSVLLCAAASAQRWCFTRWAPCRLCPWRRGWSGRGCPG